MAMNEPDAAPAAPPTPAMPARDLERHTAHVRAAPQDKATISLIVTRPGTDQREVVESARLTPEEGLVGDHWLALGSSKMPGGVANPEAQITLMSTRVLEAIEADRARWPLAGDQLYLDMDLSESNLPAGTRLAVGDAEVVVTELPHTGCVKFAGRFGHDALRWISTHEGRSMRMRGMYVRVVRAGAIHTGDAVRRI
jgi:MOSC domain-containing protein YiiM